MKNILILGATGQIGKLLVPLFDKEKYNITVYVRDAKKVCESKKVNIIEGNVLDETALTESMKRQDIVIAVLSGDLLTYANNIVSALKKNTVKRIIWITGMGIHHEVPGEAGKLLDDLCRQMPEYVQAADAIAESRTPYTLIRAAHLTDGNNEQYYIQHEGEKLHANSVDRIAVAHLIYDLIVNEEGINDSLGITN